MSENDIAIVGLAAHLPGARDAATYWRNLRDGVESVRELSVDELLEAGVTREEMERPGYVRASATLDDVFHFDADFFGLSPKEAGIMDPQQRHFLMAAWEAMEDAAHVPSSFDGAIGVFAGVGMGSYFIFNVLSNPDLVRDVGMFLLRHTGNDKDFLATRASYTLDLRGPSVNVQTACSTSLVATHLAVAHLLTGECDMALAGGVTIEIPHGRGYQYNEGEVLSPDGHCRAFDHRSQGTVFGSGTGVVALRRLDDALADGDQIYAVIKGSAVNNDGALKVGYLAPSVDGQAACITEALGVADVDPETMSYVECHGTGTPMGDPIEIAALTQAFGTDKTGYCRIGSVKTNIGHLDTAAGVASLIKVSLALRNGEIPPSLNFEEPNPRLEIDDSPFLINDRLTEWRREGTTPRRAGINSLGVGGTNAFVVVEEAPETGPETAPAAEDDEGAWRLFVLSARSGRALDAVSRRLAAHLREHPEVDLGAMAWTLQVGRHHFPERRVVAARTHEELASLLDERDPRRVFTHTATASERKIAFMFPGGGAQYPRMAADLYAAEPVFAEHLDEGLRLLREHHDLDLRPLLLGPADDVEAARVELERPVNQLPALFVVEHALARLLMDWGLQPTALVGHSMGENTAACLAGTMSFEDCLGLVALRGRLFERVGGAMTAVPLSPDDVQPYLEGADLDLSVVNSPDVSVVSGTAEAVDGLEQRLAAAGVEARRVKIGIAAHSRVLEPILDEFRSYLEGITLASPTIPWVSNRSGTWITDEQATDPGYWVDHLRHTVRFGDCISTLAEDPDRVLLEVGPGKTLSSLARMHPALKATQAAIPTMRHPDEVVDDVAFLLTAQGRLWAVGGALDTERLVPESERRRIGLPTYAFQTQPFVIEPGEGGGPASGEGSGTFVDREPDEDRWYWEPVWRSRDVADDVPGPLSWLVLMDRTGLGDHVVTRLRARGDDVVVVWPGDSYHAMSDHEYVIAPENGLVDYELLLRDLVRTGHIPDRIAHLALLATDDRQYRPGSSFFHRNQELGFQSLVFLAQAWSGTGLQRPLHIAVATMGSQRVLDHDRVPWPEQSTVLGPVRLIGRELADVTASTFDIDQLELFRESRLRAGLGVVADRVSAARSGGLRAAAQAPSDGVDQPGRDEVLRDMVVAELLASPADEVVALRGDRRFVQEVRRSTLSTRPANRLRRGGVVLMTGGLGGISLAVAEELVAEEGARLAMMTRSPLPPRDTWDEVVSRLGDDHPTSRRIAGVSRLEADGAEVLLVAGDVTDVEQVGAAVAQVRAHYGALHGVVHAAGVVDDDLIVAKSASEMEDVLAPKVYGTLVLEEAVADDDIDLFVVFSSTSTVTAPIGQVDYVAANSFLNAFAQARQAQGHHHVMALDWGVWNEVGMAADAAARTQAQGPVAAPDSHPARHPYFDRVGIDERGVAVLEGRWETEGDWFLDDHRTGAGDALLPGSGYLELARAGLAEIGVDRPFEIRGLTFLRPLAAPDGGHVDVQLRLTPTEAGYDLELRERVLVGGSTAEDGPTEGRPGWRRAGEASLLLHDIARPAPLDVAAIEARTTSRESTRTHQQDHLLFGPRWQVVERVMSGKGIALARLRLPDDLLTDLDDWGLHPGLVDLGTGFAMSLIEGYTGEELWVPVDYRAVRVHDRLPAECVSVATVRRGSTQDRGFATFDVAIAAPDGTVLVEVEGFTIKRLDGALDVGLGRRIVASEVDFDQPPRTAEHLSDAERVFQHNLAQGIRPDEGRRAFSRVLRSIGTPVVYVSSMDLPALRRQSTAVARAQSQPAGGDGSAVFARPELDSELVEPRTDVEETLVGMWQELLGISQIGVRDSFFDLGGHSLIAVRLFARVKKVFSVDFPISVLFEAPTVEAVAALIEEATAVDPAEGADPDDDGSAVSTPAPRFRHLVAMHPGEGGPRTPFFLVSGMFGNVLNLRHLAHQIGTDRPFYGVQARGLYGGEEPHDDFVEMARAYLEEVRQVQPHGPYHLGGFSGGGIAAFEMAQQLVAAGEEVGLLVFLDTPTSFNPELTPRERAMIQRDNLQREGPRYLRDWAVNRVRWEKEKRRRAQEAPEVPHDDGALHSLVIEAAFYRAIDRYETRPYPGTIRLYRPKITPLHVFGPDRQVNVHRRFVYHDNGWGPFCDEVVVTEVPGDHDNMVLEPAVRVLAGHIRRDLEAADARLGEVDLPRRS